jgi:hypothetical protein
VKLALPLSAAALLAALSAAPAAHAQGADLAAAQSLFDEAKQLVAAGRIGEACPKFVASFKLDPKSGTAVNLADCFEKNGQIASAWARYLEAAALAQRAGQTDREQYARQHAAALEPRLSRLTISAPSAPPGLEVRRDGAVVDAAILGTGVAVDPGKHPIEARAPGKKPWSTIVEVAPGVPRIALAIPALEDGGPVGVLPPDAQAVTPTGRFWGTRRVAGAVVGAVGVVGIAAGAALGVLTLQKISDSKSQGNCNQMLTVCNMAGLQMQQDAHGTAHGSTAAFAVGGAALVAGVVLIVTGGRAPATVTGSGLTLGPVAGAEMTGATLRGAW